MHVSPSRRRSTVHSRRWRSVSDLSGAFGIFGVCQGFVGHRDLLQHALDEVVGRFGRMFLSGTESEVQSARDAAVAVLEEMKGREA